MVSTITSPLFLVGNDALSIIAWLIITFSLLLLFKYKFPKHTIKGKQSLSSVVSDLISFIICVFVNTLKTYRHHFIRNIQNFKPKKPKKITKLKNTVS